MSENAKDIRAIAVRLPNWAGDAVMATPALRSMRIAYPDARICVAGKAGVLQIVEGLPYFDDSVVVKGKGIGRVTGLALKLRKMGPIDLGLILPNSFSSALSFFLGNVRLRTGYALNRRRFLLNRFIEPVMEGSRRRPEPMTRYYIKLARIAGGAETDEKLELKCLPDADAAAERFLSDNGLIDAHPLVGLNPGASFGPSKLWTPEGFAHVADRVAEDLGGKAVILCGPGEEKISDSILDRVNHPVVDTSRDVIPLNPLKSVIARLDALVTTDTGPRHFASALNTPAVVLMGPTDPRYTDYDFNRARVVRIEVPCGPCHKKECDIDHVCMTGISGEVVFEALEKALSAGGRVETEGGRAW